jgi:hypothetical protein
MLSYKQFNEQKQEVNEILPAIAAIGGLAARAATGAALRGASGIGGMAARSLAPNVAGYMASKKIKKMFAKDDEKDDEEVEEGGLWDNIHAKRARGERMRKKGDPGAPTPEAIKKSQNEDMSGMSQKSGDKRSTDSGAGMTAQGVAKYNRRTGGDLKTAVTTKPSKLKPGSKAAGRRKSFCARSGSWTSERGRAARRRWNC